MSRTSEAGKKEDFYFAGRESKKPFNFVAWLMYTPKKSEAIT
jgi:hypothetical protein